MASAHKPATAGNPVSLATGVKLEQATDYSMGMLSLTRRYRSDYPSADAQGALGRAWRHEWERSMLLRTPPGGPILSLAQFTRADDSVVFFSKLAGVWTPSFGDQAATLVEVSCEFGTCFDLALNGGVVERYSADGRLRSVQQGGRSVSLSYHPDIPPGTPVPLGTNPGKLHRVSDDMGRALEFNYVGSPMPTAPPGAPLSYGPLVESVQLPDGEIVAYGYNDHLLLTSVTVAGSTRQYHYENLNFPSALTGITDESGFRYSQYDYDANGRATYSTHLTSAGPVGTHSFAYPQSGLVQVTTPLGATDQYSFQFSQYNWRLITRTRGCSGCGGASGIAMTYAPSGLPATSTDARGYQTSMTHSPNGQELRRVLVDNAVTPAEVSTQRILEKDWDPVSRALIEERTCSANASKTCPAGTPELVDRRRLQRNSRAQVTAECRWAQPNGTAASYVCGSLPAATPGVRQTTRQYCEANDPNFGTSSCPIVGVLKSTDGPRTDVNDITTYSYYAADHVDCASSPASCQYRKGDLHTVTNAASQVSSYLRYDGAGRVLAMSDANGNQTHLLYHPRGWLAERRVCPAGAVSYPCTGAAVTTMSYTPWGGIDVITQPDGSTLDYDYDNAHRLTAIIDGLGNRIDYTLDAAGNRTAEQTRDASSTLRRSLSRVYDNLSRLQSSLNANAVGTTYTYDANDNQDTATDALSVVTDNDYDPLNRLIQSIADYGTDPSDINATVQYAYDARDNLVQVTDPKGLDTEYVYNGLNDQIELHSPDTGTTTHEYDSAGNRSAQTDARGVRSEYSYDVLNRLTGIVYPSETAKNISFVYDLPFASDCPAGNHSVGRLTRFTDHSGSTTLCYDHRGNVTRKLQVQGAVTLTTLWSFDAANRVASITYPSGQGVAIGRDTVGRINQLTLTGGATLAGGGTTLLSSVLYEPFGPVRQISYGDGHAQTRSFDQNYWVQAITSTRSGGLQAYFDQDAVGNITALSASVIGTGDGSGTDRSIDYDDLYRITEVRDRNAALIEAFSYDDTGNRLNKTASNGVATGSYGYPGTSHRLTSVDGVTRDYDAAGNLIEIQASGSQPGFDFDARNRLVASTVTSGSTSTLASYDYNARGERVLHSGVDPLLSSDDRLYVYDEGGRLLGEYAVSGTPIQETLWLDDLPIATLRGSTAYPIEPDHLGSPRVVADEDDLLWEWDLLGPVFGEQAPNDTASGSLFRFDLRFPGQQYDAASGLNYNYFRDYEAGTGRYVESDPIGLRGGYATFAYVGNAPVDLLDRYGLRSTLRPLPRAIGRALRDPDYLFRPRNSGLGSSRPVAPPPWQPPPPTLPEPVWRMATRCFNSFTGENRCLRPESNWELVDVCVSWSCAPQQCLPGDDRKETMTATWLSNSEIQSIVDSTSKRCRCVAYSTTWIEYRD